MNPNIIKVIHSKGSGDCKCVPSKIKFWRDSTGLPADKCAFFGCGTSTPHGAHVHIPGSGDVYIVPSCPKHNNPAIHNGHGFTMEVDKRLLVKLPQCECAIKLSQRSPTMMNHTYDAKSVVEKNPVNKTQYK